MKKYEKPFVKEAEIELEEILEGSEYQGETNPQTTEGDDPEGYNGIKHFNVWE